MDIKLHKFQDRAIFSLKRFIAVISGIQGGKTTAGAIWTSLQIDKYPKDNHLVSAPTYKILQQSTLPKFFEIAPFLQKYYNKADQVIVLPQGGRVFIRSMEDPLGVEGMKLRSSWLDEAGQMKALAWIIIQGRLSILKGRCFISTTPYAFNWLYYDFYQKWKEGRQDYDVVQFKSCDNPYFPREEYERARQDLDDRVFKRRYEGVFEKMEGLVYEDFSGENIKELSKDAAIINCIAGVDFGYNVPAAMVVIKETKENNFYVVEEYYKSGKTQDELNEIAKQLQEKHNVRGYYPDIAEPDRVESMKRAGIYVRETSKDVKAGIDKIRELLRKKQLFISPRCINLIDEFGTYHYPEKEGKENPVKENDHALDALRYAIYSSRPTIVDKKEKRPWWFKPREIIFDVYE